MRILKSAAVAAAVLIATALAGVPASASVDDGDVNGLSIVNLGYNARGADTVWNRNKEYVDVQASGNIDVEGLKVYDRWGKANPGSVCNRFEVTSLPGVAAGDPLILQDGWKVRVHTGPGIPSVTAIEKRLNLYMGSGGPGKRSCGYKGHIWNNLGDLAVIELDGDSESFEFDFEAGYYIR